MTIEVKELTINATVVQGPEVCSDKEKSNKESELNQTEIISLCVEQVLRILENSKER